MGAARDACALAEHLGREVPEVEHGRDAGVEKRREVVLHVGEDDLPRWVRRRARVGMHVHQSRQQRSAVAVELRDAAGDHPRWCDRRNAPVPHHHVAQPLGHHRPRRVEYPDVPEDDGAGRSGRAGDEGRLAGAGRGEDEECRGGGSAHGLPYHAVSRRHKVWSRAGGDEHGASAVRLQHLHAVRGVAVYVPPGDAPKMRTRTRLNTI